MLRFTQLKQNRDLLTHIQRGIERESLRTDTNGSLALSPHPKTLGSALTHPNITTDYSEALIELITDPQESVDKLLQQLKNVHQFVLQKVPSEFLWMQSMPCELPSEAQIPIAYYGKSNTGTLKHVYRKGLAERYGKSMQCIAGLHYNYSLPSGLWDALGFAGSSEQEKQNNGYLALTRNFTRFSWLLMYLFGASPAVSASFLKNKKHPLQQFDYDTLFLPYATSLRMSDLGYQNDAQSNLKPCYNDLDSFIRKMYHAITQPWPAYQSIGTHRDDQWIQLNTNVLQIENEYYSSIRPKRSVKRCERPLTALMQRGIQYIEVRCLDIDPFEATGISSLTAYFMDAFLLFCASHESRLFAYDGFCEESQRNFKLVVEQGRDPNLTLNFNDRKTNVRQWGLELLDLIAPYAKELDIAYETTQHTAAIHAQKQKLENVELTPSAKVLQALHSSGMSLHDFTQTQSQKLSDELRYEDLSSETAKTFEEQVKQSLLDQQNIENNDDISFDQYVERYNEALINPN